MYHSLDCHIGLDSFHLSGKMSEGITVGSRKERSKKKRNGGVNMSKKTKELSWRKSKLQLQFLEGLVLREAIPDEKYQITCYLVCMDYFIAESMSILLFDDLKDQR